MVLFKSIEGHNSSIYLRMVSKNLLKIEFTRDESIMIELNLYLIEMKINIIINSCSFKFETFTVGKVSWFCRSCRVCELSLCFIDYRKGEAQARTRYRIALSSY